MCIMLLNKKCHYPSLHSIKKTDRCRVDFYFTSFHKKTRLSMINGFQKKAMTYSPTWYSSTIGADELNFLVRYG